MNVWNRLVVAALILIVSGFFFKINDIVGGNTFMALGFATIFIFGLVRAVQSFSYKQGWRTNILYAFLAPITFCMYCKYLHWDWADYLSLAIVPANIFLTFWIIKDGSQEKTLKAVYILYTVMTLPLFGFTFQSGPNSIIPVELDNRYNPQSEIEIEMPFKLNSYFSRTLVGKAFDCKKNGDYYLAIEYYRQARLYEPTNPKLLFDMAELYAKVDELEKAINLLDTAIIISNDYAPFYNNRGLYYSFLNNQGMAIRDYKKAVDLDSTMNIYHIGLAMEYVRTHQSELACKEISFIERNGGKINDYKLLLEAKKDCR